MRGATTTSSIPIPQRDYYALAGIFCEHRVGLQGRVGRMELADGRRKLPETPAQQAERHARLERHRQAIDALNGRA